MGAERVLAADGGARNALALGLTPDLLIGDLDSVDATTVAMLTKLGVPAEVLPTDKDATDGELAVRRALAWGATRITMVGALGGLRADHSLANVLLLTRPELARVVVSLLDHQQEARLLRAGDTWSWMARHGEIVSLLPLAGPVDGVRADGVRWPLRGERLELGATRGVSNETVTEQVTVSQTSGLLLVTRLLPAADDWPVGPDDFPLVNRS
ncbi:MAG: thiamine diphosphokinase [Chloroflexi bacterium]|nr:thiamine diphosphokinase [Chloroflexota bacterium]